MCRGPECRSGARRCRGFRGERRRAYERGKYAKRKAQKNFAATATVTPPAPIEEVAPTPSAEQVRRQRLTELAAERIALTTEAHAAVDEAEDLRNRIRTRPSVPTFPPEKRTEEEAREFYSTGGASEAELEARMTIRDREIALLRVLAAEDGLSEAETSRVLTTHGGAAQVPRRLDTAHPRN
ncbi:hypothetical protein [Corynebacterium sp. AOP12-C2-36]|uniref:hypothetical protein n=1 Tax=Corynebacterium sp. AOP12-C2-36 TaxID=3457723 RepID=UPI004034E22B